jgi:hypothetical protein
LLSTSPSVDVDRLDEPSGIAERSEVASGVTEVLWAASIVESGTPQGVPSLPQWRSQRYCLFNLWVVQSSDQHQNGNALLLGDVLCRIVVVGHADRNIVRIFWDDGLRLNME